MTTRARKWLALGAGLVCALALPVLGEPGDLDLTFNGTGKLVLKPGGALAAEARAVAAQADGKIVVAGYLAYDEISPPSNTNFIVARLNTDGMLDPRFNGTGMIITDLKYYDSLASVLIQPDGRILVTGTSNQSDVDGGFALFRYNSNGTLDTTFAGTGRVYTPMPLAWPIGGWAALQSDGKIVLAGAIWPSTGDYQRLALLRYNRNGSLDTTFGGTGIVITSLDSKNADPCGITIQPDGKIVIGGTSIFRFNTDGTLDSSFGHLGIVTTPFWEWDVCGVGLRSDGKILLTGRFGLARYRGNGSIDLSLNGTGVLALPLGGQGYAVITQRDSKIVVAGTVRDSAGHYSFQVVRLNPDYSLDLSFHDTGFVLTDFAGPTPDYFHTPSGIALQPDGRIVVGGVAYFSGDTEYMAIARYIGVPLEGTAQFSAPVYVVSEKALSTVVTVQRINSYQGTLVVTYEVSDGTATSGVDYMATSGTLTFGPGQRAKTIRITLLPDQIADGAETVKLTLTSSSGHLLDSATVVLRESSLALSSRKLRPGQRITALGKFDPTQPLHVRFTDHEMNDTRVRASDVTARSAKVRVPVMLDAAFEPTAAVVTVQVEQGTIIAGPVPKVSVASPALTGETPGAFTLEFLKVTQETLGAALRNWEAIDNQSEGAVDSSMMRSELDSMQAQLHEMELALQEVVDGTADHIDLGTIGSEMVSVGSDGLATLDRMLVAAVFEGKFTPATAGAMRLQRLAAALAPAAAVTPDPIGDFHDEQNPTLAQTMAGIFGIVTKCSETANTYVGKAAELVKEYVPESGPLVESAEETFAAVNYYAAVVVPAVMGNATLAMSAPFIELELGKPVDVLEAAKPGFDHLEQGSKAFLEEHKDVLIAKLETVLAGRGGTLLDFVKKFDDLAENVSKAIELEDEYSVIEKAYAAVDTIYNNRPKPVVSIDDVTVTEPATGSRNAAFLVSLDRVFDAPVTVSFGTTAGSAGPGDFTPRSGTVTIAKGSRGSFITVAVRADTVNEDPETFTVNLTAASNATLGKSVGTCTILDAKRSWSISGSITVESYGTYSLNESFTLPRSGGVRSFSVEGVATVKITVTASTMSVYVSGFKVTSDGSGSGHASGSGPIIDHTTHFTANGPISGNVHVIFTDGTACDFAVTGSFAATGSR